MRLDKHFIEGGGGAMSLINSIIQEHECYYLFHHMILK